MSRPTSTARPLSVTEELEKLEQSITLTLQGKATIGPGIPVVASSNRYRNRPQLQPGPSNRYIEHLANRGAVCGTLECSLGRVEGQ